MSACEQNSKEKAATLTLVLRADSGYEADAEYRISAEQWADVLGVCEGTRPVPAEPVNTQLLTAAKAAVAFIEGKPDAVEPFGLLREAISAAEAKAGPARLTDEDFLQEIEGAGIPVEDVAMACAIKDLVQTAVLERNGLKPIPTAVTVAPRGYSWHGDRLQKDELGTLTRKPQTKGD